MIVPTRLIRVLAASIISISSILVTQQAVAGLYISAAPAKVTVRTGAGKITPTVTDLRLGFAYGVHSLEVGAITSNKGDSLNQLDLEIPEASTVSYRYQMNPTGDVHVDVMLGFTQIDIESTYPTVTSSTETFEGASFGLGFEESISSFKPLRIRFEYNQLYRGDDLRVNQISLGLRYVF